jgi:hypothetical protein
MPWPSVSASTTSARTVGRRRPERVRSWTCSGHAVYRQKTSLYSPLPYWTTWRRRLVYVTTVLTSKRTGSALSGVTEARRGLVLVVLGRPRRFGRQAGHRHPGTTQARELPRSSGGRAWPGRGSCPRWALRGCTVGSVVRAGVQGSVCDKGGVRRDRPNTASSRTSEESRGASGIYRSDSSRGRQISCLNVSHHSPPRRSPGCVHLQHRVGRLPQWQGSRPSAPGVWC